MNKNIVSVTALAALLSGCMSTKVNNLHTTTSKLSTDFQNYAKAYNTSIAVNRALNLNQTQENLSKASGKEPVAGFAPQFVRSYSSLYSNLKLNEAYTKQNELLVEYFKKLPLVLEARSADLNDLVKNIDILNQAIEQNFSKEDKLVEGLYSTERDVITKTLNYGFKTYQYHIFKKIVREQMPIIIKALVQQKSLFFQNSLVMNNHLNEEFYKSYAELENSFNARLQVKSDFSQNDIKKLDSLQRMPYQLVQAQNNNLPPKQENKSAAYTAFCLKNQKTNKKAFLITFTDPEKGPNATQQVNFDIENHLNLSGDHMICELINVMGLLSEHKFNDIDLISLEQSIANYDESLKFISNEYLPKQEEK